jgi:ribonuclease G
MFNFGKKKQMKREILINAESLETRVAVLEDGRLEEFQVEHPSRERMVGSIYKGRIQNLEHDLQAAFVNIGMKKNAFLHYWDMLPGTPDLDLEDNERRRKPSRRKKLSNKEVEKQFSSGSEIVIQVTKGPIGTKGPRATASISIPGKYLVLMPGCQLRGVSRKIEDRSERQRLKKILDRLPVPENAGVIVRTAGEGASKRSFARDLKGLNATWDDLQQAIQEKSAPTCVYQELDLVERVVRDWLTEDVDRIIVDSRGRFDRLRQVAGRISRKAKSRIHLYEGEKPVFEYYGVEKQVEEAFQRKVKLDCGGYIILEETEALISIDVNTGKHKGKGSQEDAILEVNNEAVEEVARQLRLRNVGGLVVIDLIDMKYKKHQNAVFRAMKNSLKRDRARTNILPISSLGIMEMTRQRAEESILSSMYMDCPYCKGRGNVKSHLGMSVEIQRHLAAIMRKDKREEKSRDLKVIVHPAILERLRNEDEVFLVELEKKMGGHLGFRQDSSKHLEAFTIKDAETGEVLYSAAGK